MDCNEQLARAGGCRRVQECPETAALSAARLSFLEQGSGDGHRVRPDLLSVLRDVQSNAVHPLARDRGLEDAGHALKVFRGGSRSIDRQPPRGFW